MTNSALHTMRSTGDPCQAGQWLRGSDRTSLWNGLTPWTAWAADTSPSLPPGMLPGLPLSHGEDASQRPAQPPCPSRAREPQPTCLQPSVRLPALIQPTAPLLSTPTLARLSPEGSTGGNVWSFGLLALTVLPFCLRRWIWKKRQNPFCLSVQPRNSSAIRADRQANSNGHRRTLHERYPYAGAFVGYRWIGGSPVDEGVLYLSVIFKLK